MATPCNLITECWNEMDEDGCEFQAWVLPSFISGAVVILIFTYFFSLQMYVKTSINDIMEDKIRNSPVIFSSEILLQVAYIIENGSGDDIDRLIKKEMEIHGSEARTLCCLKVPKNFLY